MKFLTSFFEKIAVVKVEKIEPEMPFFVKWHLENLEYLPCDDLERIAMFRIDSELVKSAMTTSLLSLRRATIDEYADWLHAYLEKGGQCRRWRGASEKFDEKEIMFAETACTLPADISVITPMEPGSIFRPEGAALSHDYHPEGQHRGPIEPFLYEDVVELLFNRGWVPSKANFVATDNFGQSTYIDDILSAYELGIFNAPFTPKITEPEPQQMALL